MSKIIKVEYKKGYTIIDNECLRDESLDISERGLLVTMLSLPENWDYKGIGLTAILPCGKSKVFNSLKKLEEAGYIKRTFIYQKGRIVDCEYEICGSPIFKENKDDAVCNDTNEINHETVDDENSETLSNETVLPSEVVKTEAKKSKIAFDTTGIDGCEDMHNTHFYSSKILYPEKQETEMWECNKITNDKLTNNKDINNLSINHIYKFQKRLMDMIENTFNSLNKINKALEEKVLCYTNKIDLYKGNNLDYDEACVKDYFKYRDIIEDNIEYDLLTKSSFKYDKESLDEIVEIMTEICAFNKKPIKIMGNYIPAEIVKSKFLKLTAQEIEYVKESIDNCHSNIRNIKAYLISALYNSKNTIENYYDAKIQYDYLC